LKSEEEAFNRTLDTGIVIFNSYISSVFSAKQKITDGITEQVTHEDPLLHASMETIGFLADNWTRHAFIWALNLPDGNVLVNEPIKLASYVMPVLLGDKKIEEANSDFLKKNVTQYPGNNIFHLYHNFDL